MLEKIGLQTVNDLFTDIEPSILLEEPLRIGDGLSEQELKQYFTELSQKNQVFPPGKNFLGAGAYQHVIPSVVPHLAGRSEFYTAYTPYQAEVSQGTLQAIYEYQTMICRLTGMDVANASMYDGASALAEAGLLSSGITRKQELLVSSTVHPQHKQVTQTYSNAHDLKVKEIPMKNGVTSQEELESNLSNQTAAVIVQTPNFFGCIEDLKQIGKTVKEKQALFVASVVDPTSLGILKPPGDLGADVVVGEGQSFGNPVNFGGPFLGFMAVKQDYVRKIPGRLSGMTVDSQGKRGFVLTLQTREQHIRREKATSNICSNEALNALMASIYLATLGKTGLKKVAERNARNAHYLAERLSMKGFHQSFDAPFYNEFTLTTPVSTRDLNQKLLEKGFLGGLCVEDHYPDKKDHWLLCSTEKHSSQDLDEFVEALTEVTA
jgi:glycine dehydrogenase subunit 1